MFASCQGISSFLAVAVAIENSEEMKQFRAALQDGDVKDGPLSTDVLLNALREIEDFLPETGKKGCGKKILGKVMQQ